MKKCSSCKLEKTFDDFNRDESRKDKLAYICRECESARSKKYYLENREARRLKSDEWAKNNCEKVLDFIYYCDIMHLNMGNTIIVRGMR